MIIGISGKMGSGKNEVADMISYIGFRNAEGTFNQFKEAQDIRNTFLKNERWYDAERTLPNIHSFAENLKKCLAVCTGIDFHALEDRNVKSSEIPWLGISYRQLLQQFGEGIRGTVDKNFWVNSLLSQYEKPNIWIISDVRHIEEADAILERDGILIRVNRDGLDTDDHISETNLDDYQKFNYTIDNNGTLEDLFNKCKNLLETMAKDRQK
jgi:hypothetical protein